MKKNELVHFHGLLVTIAEDLVTRGVVERTAFADYDALGVSPLALRAPRDAHEEAVLTMARLLATALADPEARTASGLELSSR
jgi:hypothetical protein